MGFYDDEETALQYIAMAKGYDGRALIEVLRGHLADGASVLELGMGPGVDLGLLGAHFQATGSDSSAFFVERYRNAHPHADLLQLDAVELDTQRVFDAIFSNKVLHHLSHEQLRRSILRQRQILSTGGLVMHSFWRGKGTQEHHGLRFVYHTEASIRRVIGSVLTILEIEVYGEMEEDDSLYVVASV